MKMKDILLQYLYYFMLCYDNRIPKVFNKIVGGVTFRIQLSLLGMMTTEMSDWRFGDGLE